MNEKMVRFYLQAVVSLALLGSGLYILTTISWSENPELAVAAGGWVSLVVGYWLR